MIHFIIHIVGIFICFFCGDSRRKLFTLSLLGYSSVLKIIHMFIVGIFICFLAVIAKESDSVPGTRLAISENCSRCTFSGTSSLIPVRKSKVIMTKSGITTKTFKGSILKFLGWNRPCAALQAASYGAKLGHHITQGPPIRLWCKIGT